MVPLFSYVLTCPRTKQRLNAFYDCWHAARKDYLEKDPEAALSITTVCGMNSDRFERSPYWRLGSEPTTKRDRETGNGLDRRGHTACYWGHVQMWRQALAEHDDDFDGGYALFLEDDCTLDLNFFSRVDTAFNELPNDFDIVYFGGVHCVHGRPRPEPYSDNLYKIQNVNATHCYCVPLKSLPKIILWFEEHHEWGHDFCNEKTKQSEAEVDYALGKLTESGFLNGYALRRWACGQAPGISATQGRFQQNGRWEL